MNGRNIKKGTEEWKVSVMTGNTKGDAQAS